MFLAVLSAVPSELGDVPRPLAGRKRVGYLDVWITGLCNASWADPPRMTSCCEYSCTFGSAVLVR